MDKKTILTAVLVIFIIAIVVFISYRLSILNTEIQFLNGFWINEVDGIGITLFMDTEDHTGRMLIPTKGINVDIEFEYTIRYPYIGNKYEINIKPIKDKSTYSELLTDSKYMEIDIHKGKMILYNKDNDMVMDVFKDNKMMDVFVDYVCDDSSL